jgi:hypothetical protein
MVKQTNQHLYVMFLVTCLTRRRVRGHGVIALSQESAEGVNVALGTLVSKVRLLARVLPIATQHQDTSQYAMIAPEAM